MASLVYHVGALGDFLTTVPAFRAWRKRRAGERIVLLGKPRFAALLAKDTPFDEVWDAEAARFSRLFSPDPPARPEPLPIPFTSALLFSPSSSPLAGNLARSGVAGIVRQDPFPAGPLHVIDHHLSLFEDLELSPAERVPRIAPPEIDAYPAAADAVLHPGSGSAVRNWPVPRFLDLCRQLEAGGVSVAWVAGPADELRDLPRGARVWRELPLAALAAALARCRLFVGNDSGVSHLAAAAGCPVVALFGPTDPAVWAPRGKRVRVVASERMESISVESVYAVCRQILEE